MMKFNYRCQINRSLKWLMLSTAALTVFVFSTTKVDATPPVHASAFNMVPTFNFGENAIQMAQSQVDRAASSGAQVVGQVNGKQAAQFSTSASAANNTISTDPMNAVPLGQNAANAITQAATNIVNQVVLQKSFSDAYVDASAKLYDNPVDGDVTSSLGGDNTQVQTADYVVKNKVPTMYNNNLYYVDQNAVSNVETAAVNPLNKNTFTQRYHYNIPNGFMNDIQSIIKVGDVWNIYYLSNDQRNTGSSTEWSLVQTRDFKSFVNRGVAIPRNTGGWESVATGSVMLNNQNGHIVNPNLPANAILAFFTGFTEGRQNVYEAYSTDGGITFQPAQNEPVMNQYSQGGAFRDPKVLWDPDKQQIVMYIAQGTTNSGGDEIGTFTSPTGTPNTWTEIGNSASFDPEMNDDAPGMLECPNVIRNVYDYATHKEKSVLFFSGDGGEGGKGLYYQVGHINSSGLFIADSSSNVRRIDNGTDDYAANYEPMDSQGKQIMMIGWIGNWDRGYGSFMKANNNYHIGSFTLPRILTLKNGVLNEKVVEPANRLFYHKKKSNGLTLKGTNTSSKIVVTFKKPVSQNVFAMVQNDTTTNVNVFSNGKKNQQNNVTISQPFSQLSGANDISNRLDHPAKQFIFYIDKSSIEVVIPELGKIYTILKLSTDNQLKFNTQHKADVKAYRFN
ncbi:hypothetical protein MOO44_02895 [Nicoliella spurrieriana]|uniref:Glycosyl hydrolase family 32 N-terminal domain-containing protein n=1 Tax=Nicoliella spurrieriana TaxID=2925830 RepID=A0A976RT46_9LACO|nr:hypothetical protein [Nicoliella spurrieriana]UQS87126.1 hypothetical protein MOO44_02895 [Nicoliella spurrieriana]